MLARVQSYLLQGIDALGCEVEVDVMGLAWTGSLVVGLPDAAVKESLERVRSALLNSGYRWPEGRVLVSLAPADLRKEGPLYDLPIAVGLLQADGAIIPHGSRIDASDVPDPRQYMFAGELALDGRVRAVKGGIAAAMLARERGLRGVVLPADNAMEAAVVEGIEVIGVHTLAQVVAWLNGTLEIEPHAPVDVASLLEQAAPEVDFSEVRGQEAVKRAITVAAAGLHNVLMLGPAGTGKTMMARALPGILPPMTAAEAIEVTRIYSAVGHLTGAAVGGGREQQSSDRTGASSLITIRPVRAPHHTASGSAVIGGGIIPKPGEISLAHHGVLFLDELPEFPRAVLDTLRQPLEGGDVTISRAHSAVTFPARFMLVAAMNPTAKGDLPVDAKGRREMERYIGRVSRPLIDRVDIHVEAPAVPWDRLASRAGGTSSSEMREKVTRARARARARQGAKPNAALKGKELDVLAPMSKEAVGLLQQAMTELKLSARAYDKIRRVSRTIADLAEADGLEAGHVAEAVQYRLLDRGV